MTVPCLCVYSYIRCKKEEKWPVPSLPRTSETFDDEQVVAANKDQGFKKVKDFCKYIGVVDVWWSMLSVPDCDDDEHGLDEDN